MFSRLAACIAALVLMLTTPALAEIRVTDLAGRTVTLQKPAERVLLGFNYEDFLAIVGPGALDRVVAISRLPWRDWRPGQWKAYAAVLPRLEALPDVGDVETGTFSVEAALVARPDLAILAAWQYQALGPIAKKLEEAGVPIVVIDYNAQTVENHVASTKLIGAVMGTEDRAQRLADGYAAAVNDVTERLATAGPATRKVYVELGQKGPAEYGNSYGKGMWAGVIATAKGLNIATGQIGNWGPLNPEYVLSSKPDVVLIAGSEWLKAPSAVLMGFGVDPALTRTRLQAYANRPGWAELPAVRNGEVHAIYHGGARTLYDTVFLRYIAKVLHPEAFADVDPQAELERYYAEYLPVRPEGVFVLGLGGAGQ
jgi:ABC-type Fe3+-hydroxamate transport system substrate-binding protein